MQKTNRALRKRHKNLGLFMILCGLAHGYLSSENILSLNLGTFLWLLSLMLGINWLIRKKLKNKISWIKVHRALVVVLLISLPAHIYAVGGIRIFEHYRMYQMRNVKNTEITGQAVDIPEQALRDGIYYGQADAYGPDLRVEVEIIKGRIERVEIISHNEYKERYFLPPFSLIPQAIIEKQSLEVDSITGATYTSEGIKRAVGEALGKASEE